METTIQLLEKALKREPSQKFWCEQLQMSRSALAVSKVRQRLSPTIAGNLARLLGEDEGYWVAIAALEAEPDTYGRAKLMSMSHEWRKRSLSNRSRSLVLCAGNTRRHTKNDGRRLRTVNPKHHPLDARKMATVPLSHRKH